MNVFFSSSSSIVFKYVVGFMNEFYLYCSCYLCGRVVHPLMKIFYLVLCIWTNFYLHHPK